FHPVVIPLKFFIPDRPAREIERAVAPAQSGPEQRFAANGFRQKVIETRIAVSGERFFLRVHSEMAARIPAEPVLRRIVRHGVAEKLLRGVTQLAGLESDTRSAALSTLRGDASARRAGADNTDIINCRALTHSLIIEKGVAYFFSG